jgi:hypothetical protein
MVVSATLDMKHPENPGSLGGQLHRGVGNIENKLKVMSNTSVIKVAQTEVPGQKGSRLQKNLRASHTGSFNIFIKKRHDMLLHDESITN